MTVYEDSLFTEVLKFQIEKAIEKSEDLSKKIDRNLLYQIVVIFISILIIHKPDDFNNYQFSELLNLKSDIIIMISPFLLFFLFTKLGLYVKRYIDLRDYLETKTLHIDRIDEIDRILLFSNNSAAEFCYYLKKYPTQINPNIVNGETVTDKNIGISSIRVFYTLFALLIGVNNSLCIWLFYKSIKSISLPLSFFLIFVTLSISFFAYRDFLLTTKNKFLKNLVISILIFTLCGLCYFIQYDYGK